MPPELHDRVARLVTALDRMTPEERTEAIANEVIETGGTWQTPPMSGRSCFVISLHGIEVPGFDADGAAMHWHIDARSAIGGWPHPDHNPNLRRAQLEWAQMALFIGAEDLRRQAAAIAMLWSTSQMVRDAARLYLEQPGAAA
ncbi:hypothetical protein [Limimaricola cinnabarinus]|uniref:Uncharacterized protein n=1 Tax=Limimaricola cinnabarinus LL-001 TaxID=1337093 RepID=U2Z329_9RHOB|nr:hypothetical protein [Limimaricola cinnabarinus]GAD55467.1 hypothetical protein MBELCI_1519 [Limimaricola cinnabarinus LL-001]